MDDIPDRLPMSFQCIAQVGVNGDSAAASHLGHMIAQFDDRVDLARSVEHHLPCEICDLAGAKASLDRQQDHNAVAESVAGSIGEK